MIHPGGCFDYQVRVRRRRDGAWVGRASASESGRYHPGLAGERPVLIVTGGSVNLTCRESVISRIVRPVYRESVRPARKVAFGVGPALEKVTGDHAVLRVTRAGTGDLGAVLLRDQQPVLAIGTVDHWLRGVVDVEYDSRVDDDDLYWVKYILGQPDTHAIWIDTEQCDEAAVRQFIRSLPDGRLHVACREHDAARASRLNNTLMMGDAIRRFASVTWTTVDPRFRAQDDWLAYVRSRPDERPDDLHVRFGVVDMAVTLREGQHAFLAPWHIYLKRIKRRGVPGADTQMGIAREECGVDVTALIESTDCIANTSLEIGR